MHEVVELLPSKSILKYARFFFFFFTPTHKYINKRMTSRPSEARARSHVKRVTAAKIHNSATHVITQVFHGTLRLT